MIDDKHRAVGVDQGGIACRSDNLSHMTSAACTNDKQPQLCSVDRQMPSGDLRELLVGSRESPHWDEVASRCLTCGNCTMVCPTCFCTSVEDVTDLIGEHAQRWMHWASCFEFDFTFVHEGSVRQSGPSRYRHWITHKLGTWHDQFGSTGCVGCGRCIAWCPTGIDITEEMTTLDRLANEKSGEEPGSADD